MFTVAHPTRVLCLNAHAAESDWKVLAPFWTPRIYAKDCFVVCMFTSGLLRVRTVQEKMVPCGRRGDRSIEEIEAAVAEPDGPTVNRELGLAASRTERGEPQAINSVAHPRPHLGPTQALLIQLRHHPPRLVCQDRKATRGVDFALLQLDVDIVNAPDFVREVEIYRPTRQVSCRNTDCPNGDTQFIEEFLW